MRPVVRVSSVSTSTPSNPLLSSARLDNPVRCRTESRTASTRPRAGNRSTVYGIGTVESRRGARARASAARSPSVPSSPTMTATCLVPLARRSNSAGSTVKVVMRSGNRIVEMMKARVRTRSMNSRRMTARILRMGHLVRRRHRSFGADLRDENGLQRCFDHLESRQADVVLDQHPKQTLRIGAFAELNFGAGAVVIYPLDESTITEDPGSTVSIPGEGQRNMASPELALDVRERAVHHLLSSRDDHDVIAHPFCLLHDVR